MQTPQTESLTGKETYDNKCNNGKTKQKIILFILLGIIGILVLLLIVCFGILIYQYKIYYSDTNADDVISDSVIYQSYFLQSKSKNEIEDVRLPYTVIPLHYYLHLQANIYEGFTKDFTFNGSVSIRLVCRRSTQVFYLHSHEDLNIENEKIKVYAVGQNTNLISKVIYDTSRQWFEIHLKDKMNNGSLYVAEFLQFKSPLKISLKGWYLSSYKEDGKEKYLVTSQLQPTDARRVFPCMDEPGFKSIFTITLYRKPNFYSLSNMPLLHSNASHDGLIADVFTPTLNTSTYLLAFVISQFKNITTLDYKNRNFSVWARPELIDSANYALQLGTTIIEFFEKYFEIEYPLNKTDMIAVPDFAAGAMENWGLMIYREVTLIWDPTRSTEGDRQKVATVISHEIAHQWFGNLVTLDWWGDLWLNEGFATFVEYIGVSHAEPGWHMDEQFAVLQLQKVLLSDSLPKTHPIYMPVYHPDEINEIFDTISYNKGASILRMMEAFLGTDVFRAGLKIYLSKFKFKNTNSVDLWDALTKADDSMEINLHDIMNSWITKTGYPMVTVTRNSNNLFSLSQKRFVFKFGSENEFSFNNDNTTWNIPLTYASAGENFSLVENRIIWMNNATLHLHLKIPNDDWYIFNLRQTGFYRVNYDPDNWNRFIQLLYTNHTTLPRLTRAQLIDDCFNIAAEGSLDYNVFMVLSKYLKNERDYVPLKAAFRAFQSLFHKLILHESHDALQSYVRLLFNDAYQEVDWNTEKTNENHLPNLARQLIVSLACQAENPDCILKSQTLFDRFMQNPNIDIIPTSLAASVFCTAIRLGGSKEWHFLMDLKSKSIHEFSKYRIIEALGCTRDIARLKSFIYDLIKDAQDKDAELELPRSLNQNPMGLFVIWEMMMTNFKNETWSGSLMTLLKAIDKRRILIEALPIKDEIKSLYAIANSAGDKHTTRSLARLLIQLERDQDWIFRNRQKIYDWLTTNIKDNKIDLKI